MYVPYGQITTAEEHELRVNDEIIVKSTPVLDDTNKTLKVKVIAGVETIKHYSGRCWLFF